MPTSIIIYIKKPSKINNLFRRPKISSKTEGAIYKKPKITHWFQPHGYLSAPQLMKFLFEFCLSDLMQECACLRAFRGLKILLYPENLE